MICYQPLAISHPKSAVSRRSERPSSRLLALDGLEERLEVPLAEAPGAVALDDLEEERRAVLDRLGEDLQEIALLVAVREDAQFGQVGQVLGDRADPIAEPLV